VRLSTILSAGGNFTIEFATGGNNMQVMDKRFLANVYNRVAASVTTINEKILARRLGKATVEDLIATAALEQLAIQHEILLLLGVLVIDPALAAEPLPELPKKIMGFI
jgi:hypothetical protein